MSLEILDLVRDTEIKASDIIDKAQSDAKAIIDNATKQSTTKMAEYNKASSAYRKDIIDKYESECRKICEMKKADTLERCTAVRAVAENNRKKAVDTVVARIIG